MAIRSIIFSIFTLILLSCGNSGGETAGSGDFNGFIMYPIEGTNASFAEKRDAGGTILENGIVRNNKKDGMWVTYYTDDRKHIKTITNYINGQKNGGDFNFNNRGQIDSKANYINGQLHGMSGVYKLGRPSTTTEYKYGQFHGQHIEYYNSGKIQKLVEFKDGKQHGLLRYYDEDGKITLEYLYENGEKVSGGIINSESSPES